MVIARVAAVVLATWSVTAAPSQNADQLLSQARAALGGDLALDGVNSFVVAGTLKTRQTTGALTIDWVRSEKFLMVTKTAVGWRNGQAEHYEGFNGSAVIDDVVLPGDTVETTTLVESTPSRTAEEAALYESSLLASFRDRYLALTLPLFARSMIGTPVTFAATGRDTLSSGPADRLEAQVADGTTLVLFLDAKSHLPVRLEGIALPLGTGWTNAVIARARTGTPTNAAEGPPRNPVTGTIITQGSALVTPPSEVMRVAPHIASTLPGVKYALVYGDHRCGHGVCWPHRFTALTNGHTADDLTLGSFGVNAKIPASTFNPR